MGCVKATGWRVGGISASASLVCAVNTDVYLRVKPVEPQWIDVDMQVVYDVETNTQWTVGLSDTTQ